MMSGRYMNAHDARQRTLIRDRQRVVTQRAYSRDQLFCVRCATQEREVGEAMQLSVSKENRQ